MLTLRPWQVINAALTLAARPQSKVAQDNMDVFKDQWEKQVRILTEAVDDITSVDDFLSVSGTKQIVTIHTLQHQLFTDWPIEEKHAPSFYLLSLSSALDVKSKNYIDENEHSNSHQSGNVDNSCK